MLDHPSDVSTIKTVANALSRVSKLDSGDSPLTRSKALSGSNLILKANMFMPRSENTNMNRNIRMEKVPTSLKVFTIVVRSWLSLLHYLASLKSLRIRKLLIAVTIPGDFDFNSEDIRRSAILDSTIKQS